MYTYTSTRKKSSLSGLKSVSSVMLWMEWRTMPYTQGAMRVIMRLQSKRMLSEI
jgi:hypothetical protein